jgi:hypothetical protein
VFARLNLGGQRNEPTVQNWSVTAVSVAEAAPEPATTAAIPTIVVTRSAAGFVLSGQRSAKASRETNVNKRGRTCFKNADHSRDVRNRTSFGTRGSQVQILPLRPSLLPFQVISIRVKRGTPLRWGLFAPGVLRALRDQLRHYKLVDASLGRGRSRLPMTICFFRSVWPAGDSF